MVKGKDSSGADVSQHLEHKAPSSTDNSSTMSTSAKPKSSTSEAAKTQKKRRTIKRCSESDEEGVEDVISEPAKPKTIPSEITKPKTTTTRQQVTPESIDSDHEDEEESEEDEEDEEDEESSDDEQTNTKTPIKASPLAIKKQTSSKKQAPKRLIDSDDDDDVIEVASRPKRSKTQPAAPSSSKKQTAVSSKRKSNNDSDDDIVELLSKTTKTKPKANQKQPARSSSFTLTKKQTSKASKEPLAETDSEEEEDSSDEEAPNVTVSERKGNLFDAPPNTLLLHACNCVGSWGAGIALAFKKHYPDHFAIYEAYCKSKTPNSILSTCLLIPPQATGPQHWIGCLFTSRKYGRGKDSKDDIMDSTDSALQDMLEQLGDMEDKPSQIWMCKINSGSFKVPWSQTKALIEALTSKHGLHIQVVDKK
ncbi:hypothetical protein KCU98_g14901, partial [Aureobasidium melanogenum]